jgi:AbrB family looped-hinge helix DNA binding protein
MLARLTSKGQVTIPKKVRSLLNVSYGDAVDFSVEKNKVILMKQSSGSTAHCLRGLLRSKEHHTDEEILCAKSVALSKKWGSS